MFREMQRKRQALSEAEIIEILKAHDTGVLGVSGDERMKAQGKAATQ